MRLIRGRLCATRQLTIFLKTMSFALMAKIYSSPGNIYLISTRVSTDTQSNGHVNELNSFRCRTSQTGIDASSVNVRWIIVITIINSLNLFYRDSFAYCPVGRLLYVILLIEWHSSGPLFISRYLVKTKFVPWQFFRNVFSGILFVTPVKIISNCWTSPVLFMNLLLTIKLSNDSFVTNPITMVVQSLD